VSQTYNNYFNSLHAVNGVSSYKTGRVCLAVYLSVSICKMSRQTAHTQRDEVYFIFYYLILCTYWSLEVVSFRM